MIVSHNDGVFHTADKLRDDEQLGISPDRYSPLLQESTMLFCCEQAFHGAVDAFERVFRHRLSADTLEKISQRMGTDQLPPFVPPLPWLGLTG